MWVPVGDIPFERMWEDDKYWLPMLIRGERFQTRWIFDGDTMLDYDILHDGHNETWARG
jgi:8-oxo-dGTP diphosphatase